jgi:hypothetical protein
MLQRGRLRTGPVYDLGGGTFDVTLMDVKGLDMKIICSQGDHALGASIRQDVPNPPKCIATSSEPT